MTVQQIPYGQNSNATSTRKGSQLLLTNQIQFYIYKLFYIIFFKKKALFFFFLRNKSQPMLAKHNSPGEIINTNAICIYFQL